MLKSMCLICIIASCLHDMQIGLSGFGELDYGDSKKEEDEFEIGTGSGNTLIPGLDR